MSADENIVVSVDSSEIDAAVAKLDEALEKTSQLTGQTATDTGQFYTIPNSEMNQQEETDFYVIPNAELEELNAQAEETQSKVDDVVAESEQKLADVQSDIDDTETEADDLVMTEGTKMKGLESASNRITRMIPGLREAYRIKVGLGYLSQGSLLGVVGLLMVAYSIYRQISSYLEEQKQQQAEIRQAVMAIQNFTTTAQFQTWQENTDRAIRGYQTGHIP